MQRISMKSVVVSSSCRSRRSRVAINAAPAINASAANTIAPAPEFDLFACSPFELLKM